MFFPTLKLLLVPVVEGRTTAASSRIFKIISYPSIELSAPKCLLVKNKDLRLPTHRHTDTTLRLRFSKWTVTECLWDREVCVMIPAMRAVP